MTLARFSREEEWWARGWWPPLYWGTSAAHNSDVLTQRTVNDHSRVASYKGNYIRVSDCTGRLDNICGLEHCNNLVSPK